MINVAITVADVLEILDKLFKIDPEAMGELVDARVKCKRECAEHAQINEIDIDGEKSYELGLLGVINGLFGRDENGSGAICALVSTRCPNGCDISKFKVPFGQKIIGEPCFNGCGAVLERGAIVGFHLTPQGALAISNFVGGNLEKDDNENKQ